MTRGGVVVAGVVLCAVPAAGCKHSSSKSFHNRAEAICAHYRQQGQKHVSEREEERQTIAVLRSVLRDLRRLRPPPSQRVTYHRWLAAIDRLTRLLERERLVLDRDEARITAALRKEKVPRRPLTPAELKHPTSAILTRTLAPLPEWHAFVRDMNEIVREAMGPEREVVRLAKQLQLQDCLR